MKNLTALPACVWPRPLRAVRTIALVIGLLPAVGWAQPVEYMARAGLFSGAEFTRTDGYQSSAITEVTKSGFAYGNALRFNGMADAGSAIWLTQMSTGTTYRAGLFTGAEFTKASDGTQDGYVDTLTESGILSGYSYRYNGDSDAGTANWVTDATTGITHRIGLFTGPEFTRSSDNYQSSWSDTTIVAGFLTGGSVRYNGADDAGTAVWVAQAQTGVTTRAGLFTGPEFTRSTDNYQYSEIADAVTAAGYVAGYSLRYNGADDAGSATWVMNAHTGTTSRIGFFTGAEFTRADGYQYSWVNALTESGYVLGGSRRYNGLDDFGDLDWVLDVSTGTTTRIGLFSGPEFTRADGYQDSMAQHLTESGLAAGRAIRYNGSDQNGYAAWVADGVTGTTTRIGLFTGAEFTDSSDGYQHSRVEAMTESGYVHGVSKRYNGAQSAGDAVWVADGNTGVTTRIGLFTGPEFTESSFGNQYSKVGAITESGYVFGRSSRYFGSDPSGSATWMADAATGVTTRVGLYTGPEFANADGYQVSFVDYYSGDFTESGYVFGYSNRYDGNDEIGEAAWVAHITTGVTTRIGLFTGAEFTKADGTQFSAADAITESGFLRGVSYRYDGSKGIGQAAWVAHADTGVTTRVGIFDGVHTAADGTQYSEATGLNADGVAIGYSTRYNGDDFEDGQTAWVFRSEDDVQIAFDLSVRPSDGYAYSKLEGINASGIAYGTFTLFDDETELGARAFVWTDGLGTLVLDDAIAGGVAQYGWDALQLVTAATDDYYALGTGALPGNSASSGVFLVLVPEPSVVALLALAGLFVSLFVLRRRMA